MTETTKGLLTIRGITHKAAARLVDQEWGSVVWADGKCYPTFDIEVEYREAAPSIAGKPHKGHDRAWIATTPSGRILHMSEKEGWSVEIVSGYQVELGELLDRAVFAQAHSTGAALDAVSRVVMGLTALHSAASEQRQEQQREGEHDLGAIGQCAEHDQHGEAEGRLLWLEETLMHCPHAELKYNDDADEGYVGWSLLIEGCSTLDLKAPTLDALITLGMTAEADEDHNVIASIGSTDRSVGRPAETPRGPSETASSAPGERQR